VGPPPPPPDPYGLSAREREVLAMLVDGRTNREIGAALFISEKTASVHVTHILDKMGVTSRGAAAALAARAGLVGAPER
jgi:DNA-binding CsgD family transcriptional regulator